MPYKRRKRDSESGPPSPTQPSQIPKKPRMNSTKSPGPQIAAAPIGSVVPASIGKDQGIYIVLLIHYVAWVFMATHGKTDLV